MENVLVTFIYPNALKYIKCFVKCIQEQSYNDFTLVVFNDGVKDVNSYFINLSIPFRVVEVGGTPTQVRFKAFDWLKHSEFKKVVFHDIDDLMSVNRLYCLFNLLDKHYIVANDLCLMNEDGSVYAHAIWGERLGEEFKFNYDFIANKNILGIGNSGIRKEMLNVPIVYSEVPLVADWFMYYQILFNSKKEVMFTDKCQTYYRQHSDNMAGVKKLDTERLNYVFKVKEAQYKALNEVGINVTSEEKKLEKQKMQFENILYKNKTEKHFFWWEETLI